MKFINYILPVFGSLVLLSCSNEKKEVSNEKAVNKISYVLNSSAIYRPDSIMAAHDKADESQKAESRKLFLSGLDLLANKNDAAASIEYFKEAICYYPDEKNYKYLFQAYLKNNNLDLADSVNGAMEDRIAASENTFNSALIFAAKKDTANCINQLLMAVDEGFIFNEKIVNEKLFDFIKENQSFQSMLINTFGNDEKLTVGLFKSFLKTFPELELPYEMVSDSARNFNFDRYIDYDFAHFIPGFNSGRFSRDVTNEYMAVGKFKTETGIAIIYKSYDVIADTLNPVSANLIVYDMFGNIVSSETIGCFCSPLESKGFVINKNMTVDIKTYKTKWESDPLEKGYAGNKIISTEPTGSSSFIISKENKLIKAGPKEEVASSGQ